MKLLKLSYNSIQEEYLQQNHSLINNIKRIARISNYSFVLWKPKTLFFNAFQEQSLRLFYKMWCFVVFLKFSIDHEIFFKILAKLLKNTCERIFLLKFGVYKSFRTSFLRLLVATSIFQDCLNVNDTHAS